MLGGLPASTQESASALPDRLRDKNASGVRKRVVISVTRPGFPDLAPQ
jgi:hypothetical protein